MGGGTPPEPAGEMPTLRENENEDKEEDDLAFMCSYVRFVQLFRFFHFCARGCTQVHASANRCKSAGVLCSCGRFGSRGRNAGGRDLQGDAEFLEDFAAKLIGKAFGGDFGAVFGEGMGLRTTMFVAE